MLFDNCGFKIDCFLQTEQTPFYLDARATTRRAKINQLSRRVLFTNIIVIQTKYYRVHETFIQITTYCYNYCYSF